MKVITCLIQALQETREQIRSGLKHKGKTEAFERNSNIFMTLG